MDINNWLPQVLTGLLVAFALFVGANLFPTARWTRRLAAEASIANQMPTSDQKTNLEASVIRQTARLGDYRQRMRGATRIVVYGGVSLILAWYGFVAVLLVSIIGNEGGLATLVDGVELVFYGGLVLSVAYLVWLALGGNGKALHKYDGDVESPTDNVS